MDYQVTKDQIKKVFKFNSGNVPTKNEVFNTMKHKDDVFRCNFCGSKHHWKIIVQRHLLNLEMIWYGHDYLDVIHCPKLQSCAISRKYNDVT